MEQIFKKIVCVFVFLIFILAITSQVNAGGIWDYFYAEKESQKIENKKVTFADVAGLSEEKKEVQEVVEFLKDPKKYSDLGAKVPKGILFNGPPGTGKTLLAKAIAGESGFEFFAMSGSEFIEMYVGVGAKNVRELFQKAKSNSPSIIFIDEIDAIGARRSSQQLDGGDREYQQTLNQLLVEMDGLKSNKDVIVIGATNRIDVLDEALLRSGRFDRKIYIGLPNLKDREEILKVHCKNKLLAQDVNLAEIARNTTGFSGADLENLLNESALMAVRENKKQIGMQEILKSILKLTMGIENKHRVFTEKEKRLISCHEVGHAIITRMFFGKNKINKISIIPVGMAAGYTSFNREERVLYTKSELLQEIKILLAGRAAEEIIFGEIDTGASDDLEKANKIASDMVMKYGMSERFKNLVFNNEDNSIIYDEVKLIIDNSYDETLNLLRANKNKLEKIAAVLLEKENLEECEFEELFKI